LRLSCGNGHLYKNVCTLRSGTRIMRSMGTGNKM
jgi:hypothetical protein